MASPWISSQRPPADRPWLGMMLLAAIPLLSLVLIRMLWSGSSLWFLAVGIILLGAAAVIFLAARSQEQEYGRQALVQEPSRLPLILTGIGVLFLAMLLLPNFAGGGSDSTPATQLEQQQQPGSIISEVSGVSQAPGEQQAPAQGQVVPRAQPTAAVEAPAAGQTYIVQDGDTLWDIALRFDTTVEAIVAANGLTNAEELVLDQELIIPATGTAADEEGATEDQSPAERLP